MNSCSHKSVRVRARVVGTISLMPPVSKEFCALAQEANSVEKSFKLKNKVVTNNEITTQSKQFVFAENKFIKQCSCMLDSQIHSA